MFTGLQSSEKEEPKMLGRRQLRWFILVSELLAVAGPAHADDTVLYCTEQHLVGLQFEGSDWLPNYGSEESGRRYAIRFSEDFTEMSGVQGGDTVYRCGKHFPTKAPDVITCTNPLVATMVFNYSTENERFVFSLVGPGGWLGEKTAREKGKELLGDHLVMGQCQAF
jgi:hypothetical protein